MHDSMSMAGTGDGPDGQSHGDMATWHGRMAAWGAWPAHGRHGSWTHGSCHGLMDMVLSLNSPSTLNSVKL